MTKSLRKNTIREITQTKARFLSILAIIGLGVGFFVGVKATSPAMVQTARTYYTQQNLMDFRLVSTVGFDEEDLKAVKEQRGIVQAQLAYTADVIVSTEGTGNVVRLMSLPQKSGGAQPINDPVLLEGRLPEKSGEIAIEKSSYEGAFKIGDTIYVEEQMGDTSASDVLHTLQYTVVGIVQSPVYISFERGTTTIGNGKVSQYMMILPQDFKYERYTDIYAVTEYSKQGLSPFDDAYQEVIDSSKEALEALGKDRIEIFDQEYIAPARQELADGIKTYEKEKENAQQQLEKAEQELADAQKTYDSEIAQAEKELEDAQEELEQGQESLPGAITEFYEQTQQGQEQIFASEQELEKAQLQYEQGKKEYDEQIAAAQQQLEQAQKEYEKAYEEFYTYTKPQTLDKLEFTQGLLDEASKTIAYLEEQLQGAAGEQAEQLKESLKKANELIAVYQREIDYGRQQLADGEQQLLAAKKEIDAGKETLAQQKEQGARELALAKQQIDAGRAQLESAKSALSAAESDGKQQLADAQQQLTDGKTQLEAGRQELEKQKEAGLAQLEAGRQELADAQQEAQQELANAEQKLNDAQKELEAYDDIQWYVFTRDDNPGYSTFLEDANRIDAVAAVFPLFFLLVAALVCLTTMTRLVEERRTEIGTLKALGYASGSIAAKYIIYATLAGLAGCLVGITSGLIILPNVIFNAYCMMYALMPLVFVMPWGYMAIGIAAALICTTTVAFVTCRRELRIRPAALMRPKTPKAGKRILLERIPFLWNKMGFTSKVTARNLLRYKARFLMTVLGVAGCTALIVAAFALKDSIGVIVDKQFTDIHKYDTILVTKTAGTLEQTQALYDDVVADSRVEDAIRVNQTAVKASSANTNDTVDEVYVLVPQSIGDMKTMIDLHERESQTPVALSDDGAVVTEKLASTLHLQVGDEITFADEDNHTYSVPITGICENYIYGYIFLSPQAYEETYGEEPTFNMILAVTDSSDESVQEDFAQDMLGRDDVAAVSFTSAGINNFKDMIQSLNMIVSVMIICAGALAFVVLYNLTNINIAERVREIATIKVLGFYNKEVSAYVYRENIVLTLVGILVGLLLGVVLSGFIIQTVEIDKVMFGREIYPSTFLWATGLTALFSLLVNWLMYYKMKAVSMVESLKSIE